MVPCISIFIVNYNTSALLKQCLRSIFDTKGNFTVEVFVADNNSSDDSVEMVESAFPDVSLIRHSQNVGYTRAINPLLPLARGEYCLLLHPDLELLPDTLSRFVTFFEFHPKAGILGGNLYYSNGTPNPCEILFPSFRNYLLSFAIRLFRKLPGGRKLVGDLNPTEWSHRSTVKVNWVWNACMMVRSEVFETVGYFDEDFFVWFADWDLCKRASDGGWLVCYLYPAKAVHHERHSFSKEDIINQEVRYKVDGWYSAARQIRDRYVFLKKYSGPASIFGIKTICIVENTLRLCQVLGNFLFRKIILNEFSSQLRVCLQTIHAILKY